MHSKHFVDPSDKSLGEIGYLGIIVTGNLTNIQVAFLQI